MKRKTVFKILRIVMYLLLAGVTVILILIFTVKFRLSDEDAREEMGNDQTEIIIDYFEHDGRKTRGILAKKGNPKLLVLLHGSPSSCAQWVPLVNDSILSQQTDFLLIDRPGYGYSEFGDIILDVKNVAQVVHDLTAQYASNYEQILVLGTSYGGTVAARLLMDYPGFVDAGILISSSMAPGEEKTYPISYFMERVPWLFPRFLMIANEEKLSHRDELEKMEPLWSQIQDPIVIVHSTNDELVYPSNVEFVLSRVTPELPVDTIWVKDGDHSLYWSRRKLFFDKVRAFVSGTLIDLQAELHPSGRRSPSRNQTS